MNPLISVIVPVYNGELYLAQALASIERQTYSPTEIIVVDDGSSDASAAVAQSFQGVFCISQEQCGISGARNTGIRAARGEYLALLDADDIWMDDKLAKQMEAFQSNPKLEMAFAHVEEFISPELEPPIRARLRCEAQPRPGVLPSALCVERNAFERVGYFETSWRVGEFASWVLRSNEVGLERTILADVLVRRRIHVSNHGIRQRKEFNDYARIFKASLDRRRAAGLEPGEGAGE
jgi:glycosyltransferase involved in cell wall biosynthesis